jgi:hypothetical protein
VRRSLQSDSVSQGADAPVLSNEVDDTPATIPLLDMSELECRDLRSPEAAAEQNGGDSAVAQALWSL